MLRFLLRSEALAPKAVFLVERRRDREALLERIGDAALREAGSVRLTEAVLETDHRFSSARIAL